MATRKSRTRKQIYKSRARKSSCKDRKRDSCRKKNGCRLTKASKKRKSYCRKLANRSA